MKFVVLIFTIVFASISILKSETPNVLFITVDDMNDWVGCMSNNQKAITPHIDRLAKRGTYFTNAHTAGVYCAPSRTSIFTGQFASTTGCYQYQVYHAVHPQLVPLQVSFNQAGYNTFGTGKLFHHSEGQLDLRGWTEFHVRTDRQKKTGWPMDSWSDEMPFPESAVKKSSENKVIFTKKGQLKWGVLANEQESQMADTIRTDWAVAKLKEKHDKPFFLALGLYSPHIPNYCPKKYFDLYDSDNIPLPAYKTDDLDDLPEPVRSERIKRYKSQHEKLEKLGVVKEAIHAYLACISYADAQIGRVLDALENSPYAKNTIVVLWSDHGFHLGEKGHWGKKMLWERTSNVPFIWSGPNIAKGKASDVTVSLIDMYPTFVEMCGLKPPTQKLEGTSLASTLVAPDQAQDRNVFLPHREPNSYAIINRNWRYIRYSNDTEELYDLNKDPNEWFNIADKVELKSIKDKMKALAPATFAKPAPNVSKKNLVVEDEKFYWKLNK